METFCTKPDVYTLSGINFKVQKNSKILFCILNKLVIFQKFRNIVNDVFSYCL